MLDNFQPRCRNVMHLPAGLRSHLRHSEIGAAPPATPRLMADHHIRIVDLTQRRTRRTRLLPRLTAGLRPLRLLAGLSQRPFRRAVR